MSLPELNETLEDYPYVAGYSPSQADVEALKTVSAGYEKFVHVKRWVKHMASFSDAEKKAFPAKPNYLAPSASTAAQKGAPKAETKAAIKAAPKGGDDDDDMDLFGSDDDEEAEKAKAERAAKMAQQKKGGKPGVIAKSSVVLDIKVWDDETDLKEVEKLVRDVQKDGLLWGSSKLVPVAFGMNKLQIVCVVEDEKVSVDWLTDQIEELELVQSTDIAAFQKI